MRRARGRSTTLFLASPIPNIGKLHQWSFPRAIPGRTSTTIPDTVQLCTSVFFRLFQYFRPCCPEMKVFLLLKTCTLSLFHSQHLKRDIILVEKGILDYLKEFSKNREVPLRGYDVKGEPCRTGLVPGR